MKTRSSPAESSEEVPSRLKAELSASALVSNYHAIRDQVPGQGLIPMVKADAYGHGAVWVSRQILELPDLYGLGVATLEEGRTLRRELGSRGRRTRILVFSGTLPWTEEKGRFCEKHGLTPVIGSDDDWDRFFRCGWPERLPYELKFNTGMNRLGMGIRYAAKVVKDLRSMSSIWRPGGILSHLAMGENPRADLSQLQGERFAAIRSELATVFPQAHFHLANSAAIWNSKHWGLSELTDTVRPGISLYGIPPWEGAPARGLKPVMTLWAQVVAIHTLRPGESIGYAATFSASKKSGPVRVAVLSAGYADGVHRMLSGIGDLEGGSVWISGQQSHYLGLISMDLCAVRCPARTQVGEWVQLLGPEVDIWAQSRAAGTTAYELLTSVSGRVKRVYG